MFFCTAFNLGASHSIFWCLAQPILRNRVAYRPLKRDILTARADESPGSLLESIFQQKNMRAPGNRMASVLLLIHALRVGPGLGVDANEVAFVNEHRYVNGCACFKGYRI